MALVPWYKDKDTKEWCYYDTDDLNDEEYAELCRINEELEKTSKFSEKCELWDKRNALIHRALSRCSYMRRLI